MTCPDCERYKQSASMWRNKAYELGGTPLPWEPEELLRKEYERGFIDGMQKQMQSSVDKAVNRMAQPAPVLTGIDCSCGRKWRVVNNTLTASGAPEYQSTADKSKLEKVPAKGTLLAQPEQEQSGFFSREAMRAHSDFHVAQQEQEPVAWMQESTGVIRSDWGFEKEGYTPLYTTPPQRTWVGLTEEEILKETPVTGHIPITSFARALEAKLKEKNT